MKQPSLIHIIVFLAIIAEVIGSFKIKDSQTFPDLIHFRSADFGYIPYGKIISGKMISSNVKDQEGCLPNSNPQAKQGFLFVKYGKCSILQKAFAAQQNKAKMLIVIADHDYIDEVHILNNGKADKVTIPVLLFPKTIGEQIYRELAEKYTKLDGMCFFPRDISNEGPVKVDYWFDPLDSSNYKYFYQFGSLHKDLGDDIQFRVHLALSFGQENADFNVKMNSCVSNGKYCGHDPENMDAIKGKDVVLTGLAILCLQNQDASYKLTKTLYEFDYKCLIAQGKTLQYPLICLAQVAQSNGYKDTNFTTDCFSKQFENQDMQGANKLLEQEKSLFQSETVQIWPELYVNSRAIRGNIQSLEEVESAICAGYSDSIPSACFDYFEYADDSIGVGYIILMVILSAFIMFGILFGVFKFYYHRKFKNQIDGEVNNVIQKYMSFNDQTDNS